MIDRAAYERDGYALVRQFAKPGDVGALLDAAVELARRSAAGEQIAPAFVTAEANLADRARTDPEAGVSKVFRVHRMAPFDEFAMRADLLDLVAEAAGADELDCFSSQFIFKNPGAWGQPCHQDSFYFPFTPMRPVVGAWLASTDSALDNGCLHVVPGSSHEPVHDHVPDRRPNANYGYFEIVDHDLANAVAVEMEPGDLLLFDSHLMHFSADNESTRWRAAMVYHYAPAGTVDHTEEQRGYTIHDWVPARRR
ncbi:MAG: phytanoyl-CoA dioxygenase family protein [Actinomycetota bacterium]|nr:phytanoyl-CoA dioxygenase family protein [Actinomycetota bacterium]